jgi:hypothetical protein
VKDAEVVQRVRQHAPSSLMPLVARYGAEYADPEKYQTARRAVYAPWVLADVARLRLVRGTEFRSKPATDDDLLSAVRPTSLGLSPGIRAGRLYK